jgi:hypothetical protein
MKRSKAILGGLVALAVGGFLVYSGVKEYRNSKRLVNEGKSADAKVTDKDMTTGRKGRRSYYLAVQFKTEAGKPVEERLQVSSSEYDSAAIGATVPVHYLADDPTVCQVGSKAEVKWTTFAIGAFLAVVGGFSVLRNGSSGSHSSEHRSEEVAETADASSSDDSGDAGGAEEAA